MKLLLSPCRMRRWAFRHGVLLTIGILGTLPAARCTAQGTIAPQPDQSYVIKAPDYQAKIGANGILSSLQIGGAEFLQSPLLYGTGDWRSLRPLAWTVVRTEQPAADTLKFTLAAAESGDAAKPALALTYSAQADGLHLTLTKLADWGGAFSFSVSSSVVAVESRARPGYGFPRLPGKGLVYALPLVTPQEGVRDLRYYLANGRGLDVFYRLNDAPYNRQGNGILSGSAWGRSLSGKQPITFIFAPVREAAAAKMTALGSRAVPNLSRRGVPFHLMPETVGGMFPVGSDAAFQLKFAVPNPLAMPHTLACRILDFNGRAAGQKTIPIAREAAASGVFRFTVRPKGTGWFRLIADLRPDASSSTLPNQDDIEFGIYTPKPNLVNPPVNLNSTPAVTGLLGLRCIRYALDLSQRFPALEKSPVGNPNYDWTALDREVNPFFDDCAKNGMTGFFLLNNKPKWAAGDLYTTLIRQIVTRCRSRNHYWEIENEPNERYTPESYVQQALKPAYRAVHEADPQAVVMGPAIVRVDLKWFAAFFQAGGGAVVDAISTHTYTGHNRSWEEHGNVEMLRDLRVLMARNHLRKPIWQTEEGFTFNNHAEMPLLQAAYVVRMFALAAASGIPPEHCHYFYTRYNGFEPWYLFDQTPNRAGMAVRIFAERTAGMHFNGEIEMGKFAHALRFTDGRQDTLAVWTDDFKTTARFQTTAGDALQVADFMGNPVSADADSNGVLRLSLSGCPCYLHLPHDSSVKPLDLFPAGTNWAAAEYGGTASASSYEKSPDDAANLNDGTWHFNDGQSDEKIWLAKAGSELPQWAAVRFAQPRRIDTVAAVTPSSNVALPGPRHFRLQVMTDGAWKTMREVENNTTEWVLYAHFAPVMASGVRVVLLDLNNGWWREDKTRYTDMTARVYELEAYGR